MSKKRDLVKAALWRDRIGEWAASKKSIRSWCLEKGVSISTFSYWREALFLKREPTLKKAKVKKSKAPLFVEIPSEKTQSCKFVISIKGMEVAVEADFDEESLYRCLRAMRRANA